MERNKMIRFFNEPNDRYVLEKNDGRLQLRDQELTDLGPIYVDFTSHTSNYRRKYGGGRRQSIARAVGLKKGARPSIIDATAGLGRDAFVLASLGCRVHMIERSPAVSALLEDGLSRARLDDEIGAWVSELMSFSSGDSRSLLQLLHFEPDIIYLDPMFPERKNKSLVKKEMRIFKDFLGNDPDADELLNIALKVANDRVVVKRPSYAKWLAAIKPETSITTKKHRFDIYLT